MIPALQFAYALEQARSSYREAQRGRVEPVSTEGRPFHDVLSDVLGISYFTATPAEDVDFSESLDSLGGDYPVLDGDVTFADVFLNNLIGTARQNAALDARYTQDGHMHDPFKPARATHSKVDLVLNQLTEMRHYAVLPELVEAEAF